jgi:hypothetical protein
MVATNATCRIGCPSGVGGSGIMAVVNSPACMNLASSCHSHPSHQHIPHTNTYLTSITPTHPSHPLHQHIPHTHYTNTSLTPITPIHPSHLNCCCYTKALYGNYSGNHIRSFQCSLTISHSGSPLYIPPLSQPLQRTLARPRSSPALSHTHHCFSLQGNIYIYYIYTIYTCTIVARCLLAVRSPSDILLSLQGL